MPDELTIEPCQRDAPCELAWLRTFLALPNGIPSHVTFRRVFMLIDPDAFEAGFTTWAGSLAAGFEREVVAIDGKTLRSSFDRGRDRSPLHVVSAWASAQGLVLGQRCVDDESNEITSECLSVSSHVLLPAPPHCAVLSRRQLL